MGSLGKGRHFPPGAWSKGVAARPEEWPAATALAFERPGDSAQGPPLPEAPAHLQIGLLLHPALCPGPCKQRFVSSHRLLLYKPLSCGLCFRVIPPAPTASRPSSGLADSRNGHGLRVPSSRLCSLSPRRGLCGLQDGVPTLSQQATLLTVRRFADRPRPHLDPTHQPNQRTCSVKRVVTSALERALGALRRRGPSGQTHGTCGQGPACVSALPLPHFVTWGCGVPPFAHP